MMVKFWGDPKKLAAIVIEAVTNEKPDLEKIYCSCDVETWRGVLVRWFCMPSKDKSGGKRDGGYLLNYPNGYADWPGIKSADHLCELAGVVYEPV